MHKESILAGLAVAIMMVTSGGAVEAFDYTTPPLLTAYDDGSYEGGNSIKTDSLDNIYAAVLSQSGNGKIIKYSADNQLQWVKEFDPFNPRPADFSPYVTSTGLSTVAIDNSNNVYAVGESFNGVSLDCLLKKYTPEGELLWERRYNELLPNVTSVNHFCNDLTIDAAGNVVAVGTTQPFNGSSVVNWTNRIIKWDSNGNLLGTFGIENGDACGPAYPCMFQIKRVAADAAGNIVTIERHQGLMSDRVAKYDQFLQLQSATPMIDYSGTISSDFYLRCKDLDSDIIAYDPTVIDQCNDMALNMFAGTTVGPQASTLLEGASTKINSNLYSLAIDPSGSIFAVGFEGDYNSLLVLNSDLSTSCQDKRMYAPTGNGHDLNDFYHGVVTAPNGNAFVVGSESRDFLAMEYNAQCQPQWVDAVGGVTPLRWRTQYRDFGTAITLDSQNNLVVFGQALKFMPDYTFGSDAVISKFVRTVATSNPDLSLEAVTAPTDGQALQNITISGSTANNGTGSTEGNFRVSAYISTDAAITAQDTAICNVILPAQEAATTQTFSCSGALPINLSSGAYYIGVLADDGNGVSESDETNNTWSAPFQFTALPDLTVAALTVPAGSNEGSPVTISGTVANPGIGFTNGPVRVSAYLSNGTPLCTADVGPMAAGETKDFTCTATTPSLSSGTYTVIAHVNQDNAVAETAAHNNTASAPMVITALPDLVVTGVVAPSFAKKSSKITFTSTIANQGSAASDYFFVRGYVSTDSQVTPLDSFVCSNASGAIAPGASAQFTCTGTLSGTLTRGSYWVGVYVDPTYRVSEINENNNSMAKPFIIE